MVQNNTVDMYKQIRINKHWNAELKKIFLGPKHDGLMKVLTQTKVELAALANSHTHTHQTSGVCLVDCNRWSQSCLDRCCRHCCCCCCCCARVGGQES